MFCIKELTNFEDYKYVIDFCSEFDLALFNKENSEIEAKILLDLHNNYVLVNKHNKPIKEFTDLKEAIKALWEYKNV